MSGGGGGGGHARRTSSEETGGAGVDACYLLVERAYVSSPDPNVVATISKGDRLTVSLDNSGGAASLLLLTASGSILGSVVPPRMHLFLKCISEGVNYVAIILKIDGGMISIELRAIT